ncbi:hypothetical protein [Lentibacillus salicampi]|uniref:Sigma-70 family RNA polymerase sigma factor n=1 Tax=Lentibacillus salicampi TaxID=175306 RepID=A0A4Y9ACK2_9BACI|nr:hypothetical protein [Lentibacillus salicampi]TFJ92101.1 hypothetical protein E4U82_14050 [Lentibacillus salicampi]
MADSQRVDAPGEKEGNDIFWNRIRDKFMHNQWKWVQFYIMDDMSLKEIARQEGVTIEAVKSWGPGSQEEIAARQRSVSQVV